MEKTRTPGNYGRPENPDHYLNDDLKENDERSRTCWGIEEEAAIDQMRVEAEKMWQTSDPTEQIQIAVNAMREFFKFSVANEIGRQSNVIWRAESDFEDEQRQIEYNERLNKAIEHFKAQAGKAPYYFSHFWAVEQGFNVAYNDIQKAVLAEKPDPREELMFEIWKQEIEKTMIWDNHLRPDENSPAFAMRGEVLRRQDEQSQTNIDEQCESYTDNMKMVSRMPIEIINVHGADLVEIYEDQELKTDSLTFKANSWETKEASPVSSPIRKLARRMLGAANLRARKDDLWDSEAGREYRKDQE